MWLHADGTKNYNIFRDATSSNKDCTMSPLLSLENWRRIISYHPWHFWQLADNSIIPVTSNCNTIVRQYAWQDVDAAGRSDILEAIANAESSLAELLTFWPMPRYAEKTLQFPQFYDHGVWRISHADGDGRWLDVNLPSEGFIDSLGPVDLELLGSQAVTLSDADGDDLDETFTLAGIVTTETDTDNIAVYFSSADRLDDVLENWRILPIEVTISAGSVVVTGKSWQIVRKILYEGAGKEAINPTDDANFAATLDVYVRKTNVTGITNDEAQALLIWETNPYPNWAVCCGSDSVVDSSTDPAAEAIGIARAGIRDSEIGIVNLGRAAYNAGTGVWSAINWGICRPPDRALVRYYAGYPSVNGDMAKKMQIAVARLAAAELPNKIAACNVSSRELERWQFDLSRSDLPEVYAFFSAADLENPLGTLRGHVYAWKFVKEFRNLEALVF
jgi:hypothetical protein